MQRIQADRETFDRFQTKQLVALGLEVASTVSGQQEWPCAHCHRAFTTYQGLRSHARQAHGELHVSNQYAKFDNGFWTCAACLEAFATKNNLVRHLKSHKKCLDLLVAVCPCGFGSDPEALKGIKLHDGNTKDAVQLYGPLIGRPVRSWFAEGFSQGDLPEGMVGPVKGVRKVDVARDAYQGLGPDGPVPVDIGGKVPRLLRMRVFLIAFGGRRRQGDTVFYLERYIAQGNWNHRPFVCCLDLVLSPKHDVARGALYFWCCRIVDGFVVGTFQSPPCETWSISRYLQLALGMSGPPPLRSGDRPFGLDGLTFKQYKQLEIGSFLLFSSLAMITCAALSGCSAMLEHPAFLKNPKAGPRRCLPPITTS